MATVERCALSDLPADCCGCAGCRPDLVEQVYVPVQHEGTWREALYAGTCECGCGERVEVGDDIMIAQLENGRYEWCLMEHTRATALRQYADHVEAVLDSSCAHVHVRVLRGRQAECIDCGAAVWRAWVEVKAP